MIRNIEMSNKTIAGLLMYLARKNHKSVTGLVMRLAPNSPESLLCLSGLAKTLDKSDGLKSI